VQNSFQAERDAFQRFAKLLNDIEDCRRVFEAAGVPLPDPLRRILGGSNGNGKAPTPALSIMPLHRQSRPPGVEDNWLSVQIGEASSTGLVQAVLRSLESPMKAKDVIEKVIKINPKIPRGSVHNIGTRLDGTIIRRSDEGWSLIHPETAAIIHEGFLWGPKSVFDKTEIAAHRREAILHILNCFAGGLQNQQIVEQLKGCDWVHAPSSKDLVKADMELLEAHNKVRRISNSRKWIVIPQTEGD
jgi:hypothetical protein